MAEILSGGLIILYNLGEKSFGVRKSREFLIFRSLKQINLIVEVFRLFYLPTFLHHASFVQKSIQSYSLKKGSNQAHFWLGLSLRLLGTRRKITWTKFRGGLTHSLIVDGVQLWRINPLESLNGNLQILSSTVKITPSGDDSHSGTSH